MTDIKLLTDTQLLDYMEVLVASGGRFWVKKVGGQLHLETDKGSFFGPDLRSVHSKHAQALGEKLQSQAPSRWQIPWKVFFYLDWKMWAIHWYWRCRCALGLHSYPWKKVVWCRGCGPKAGLLQKILKQTNERVVS